MGRRVSTPMALLLFEICCLMDGAFMRTALALDHFLSLLHHISHHCPWTSALTVHARQDRNGSGSWAPSPGTVTTASRVAAAAAA